LLDELRGLGVIAAPHHAIGAGVADFIDNGGIVGGSGIDALEKDDGNPGFLGEGLHELGEALSVVALVVKDGDLAKLKGILNEGYRELCLRVVRGDRAEEIGILAALVSGGFVAEGRCKRG
jgi:hypothetical protein